MSHGFLFLLLFGATGRHVSLIVIIGNMALIIGNMALSLIGLKINQSIFGLTPQTGLFLKSL